ncbi:hypothetical protein [Mycoplana dimorpha]|uniref:Uncharacterized protein n=1 Tax=Mycoplana dimorpha TaxID=28320 RepID=A0A2T5BFF5_MYCDI|nr:hypothetical protein [Mycoplana dimorpha]PTM97706.1 hypothetical protein C7449_102585 [Mycoplana dimorpha]
MSLQLARYLKDFSPPRQPHSHARDGADEVPFDLPEPLPQIDIEAERAEAFAAGRAQAEAELASRHHDELEALRLAHAAELAALRTHCDQQAGARIAQRFAQMEVQVAELVASQTANVLAPILGEALSRKAIADLAAMVRAGLSGGEGFVVTVTGPTHLFEQLRSHFEGEAAVFRHQEADDLDLAVEFGETVLVTRMAAWADTIRKVLA